MIDVFINSRNKIFGPLFKLYFPAIKYYKTTYVHETMHYETKHKDLFLLDSNFFVYPKKMWNRGNILERKNC